MHHGGSTRLRSNQIPYAATRFMILFGEAFDIAVQQGNLGLREACLWYTFFLLVHHHDGCIVFSFSDCTFCYTLDNGPAFESLTLCFLLQVLSAELEGYSELLDSVSSAEVSNACQDQEDRMA